MAITAVELLPPGRIPARQSATTIRLKFPARSYTLLGGGTMVQDNVTGLICEMQNSKDGMSNYSNPNDADNTYTWCDPNPDTNGGYTSWRLPTLKELATLADLGRVSPAIDPVFAATTQSSYYWSLSLGNHNFDELTANGTYSFTYDDYDDY